MVFSLKKLFFRLPLREKMLFARNMEVMIKSGMQVIQSLEVIKKQTRSRFFIGLLDQLIADVRNGRFLSAGLEQYREVFGDFFINLVRVGESSGTLSENLGYLAEELQKKNELKKKVRDAMVYPLIILAATLGITAILTFFVFPKILPVLTGLKVDLPVTTRTFIAISNFLFHYGLWTALAAAGIIITWFLALKTLIIRYYWQKFVLRIPGVGAMVKTVNLVSFSRTIGILLRAGVQIVEAVNITADTLTNVVYQKEIRSIAEKVRQGDPVSKYLVAKPDLFPAIFSQMVSVGENTGKLDESFLFLAGFYESELDGATKSMSNVLEPMLLLVMGAVVVFVALAIITPIYKMTQNLGR